MKTHDLIKHSETWYTALGLREYFSWDIFFEEDFYNWKLWTVFGNHYKDFNTLGEVLDFIGYNNN